MMASELILICECGNHREAMPFESFLPIGGQTSAHCNKCGKTTKHKVTLPIGVIIEPEEEE